MEKQLLLVIVLVIVVTLVIWRKGYFGQRPIKFDRLSTTYGSRLPYQKKWYLLSQSERSFYQSLREAAGEGLLVFAKVRLLDLLWLPENAGRRQHYMNRVMSKHVDFVLCDRQTIAPILVVELDDSSHRRAERQERDRFVDEVLHTAGLPILRVPVRHSFVSNELRVLIQKTIGHVDTKNPATTQT